MPVASMRLGACLTALLALQGCQGGAFLTITRAVALGPAAAGPPALATHITTTPLSPDAAPPRVGGPVILGFSRQTVASGDLIVIQGANFDPALDGNQVLIGGIPATIFKASATSLTVMVPPGATQGAVTVKVLKSGAVAASAASLDISVSVGAGASAPAGPSITGLSRLSGSPGDEVVVSGSGFSALISGNQVFFGGVQATVTAASSTGLTVVVPPGAQSGPVTVTISGAQATSPSAFSVPTGLGAVTQPATTLWTTRWLPGTVIYQGSLYVIGGYGGVGATQGSVEQSAVQPDGSLGAFSIASGVNLVTERAGAATLISKNHVYMVGGYHSQTNAYLSDIEGATFDSSGQLNTFTPDASATLPTPCYAAASGSTASHFYLAGGFDAAHHPLNSVFQAAIAPDGTLGPFSVAPSTLNSARVLCSGAVIGNHFYVFGGEDGAPSTLASVEESTIQSDGSLGPFTIATGVAAPSVEGATTAIVGNNLYLVGGWTDNPGSTYLAAVSKAPIQPDGTLGAFVTVPGTTLATPRWIAAGALIGDSLFVLGGDTGARNGTSPIGSIERIAIH